MQNRIHCVTSVQIRSFFWSVFGHFSRRNQLLDVYRTDPNITLSICLFNQSHQKTEKTCKTPMITKGILVSIKKKDKMYNKFCRAKNQAENEYYMQNLRLAEILQ